ncbi:MAG: SH3 domain-containing protein [Candidatus Omnitrophota bacterium]
MKIKRIGQVSLPLREFKKTDVSVRRTLARKAIGYAKTAVIARSPEASGRRSNLRQFRLPCLAMTLCFSLFIFLLSPSTAHCGSTDKNLRSFFVEANTAYGKGDYDKAIIVYNKILSNKVESGAVYYNLGNAYFKKGGLGRAILSYERAKRLIPRDRDLKANYKYALSEAGIASLAVEKNWFLKIRDNMLWQFTINELTFIMFTLYLLIAVSILLGIVLSLPKRWWVSALGVFLLILVIAVNCFFEKKSLVNSEAVVLVDMAEARFEPSENATRHFSLPEGLKVRVVDLRNGWSKIKRYDGNIGWVRDQYMEII